MPCILGLHFFSFHSSQSSFVYFISNKIIFMLANIARWDAQKYQSLWCTCLFPWLGGDFLPDKTRNAKKIYDNIVVVEMVIFRWGTVTSSQVNFLTVVSRSTKILCPCLVFPEELSSCHISKLLKYCTFRTHFPEKPWMGELKVVWAGPCCGGSA